MTYADQESLIADYLPEVRSDAELAAIGRILEAVSAQIDNYCDRPPGYFAPAGEATTRTFRGANRAYLQIPVHVGAVTVSGTEYGQVLTDTGWVERGGWVYRQYLNGGASLFTIWFKDVEYTVTGRWGYETTPLDVVEACRQLVVHYFERARGTYGQLTPTGFIIERDLPPPVVTLLAPYIRKEFEIT